MKYASFLVVGVIGSLAFWVIGCGDDDRVRSHHDPRPHKKVVVHERPSHEQVIVREERPVVQRETVVVRERPVYREKVVVIRQAPPPVIVERRPPPPSRTHVWVSGYYNHDGHRYVWVKGHYNKPPRQGARWEADRWERKGEGYRHVPGRWR